MEKNKDSRFGVRLTSPERKALEKLVAEGKYENLSEAIRTAISEFLTQKGV